MVKNARKKACSCGRRAPRCLQPGLQLFLQPCLPLWIECRGVETAHWARMFAIHSRPSAAAICPQLAATAVICTSSLLQPTNRPSGASGKPFPSPICALTLQQPSNWSGLEVYHLFCPSIRTCKKKEREFFKWTGGNFCPRLTQKLPKTLFALGGMCSSQMPCPYQSMHGKPSQG